MIPENFSERLGSILAAIGQYMGMTADFMRPSFQIGPPEMPNFFHSLLGAAGLILAAVLIAVAGWRRCALSRAFPFAVLAVCALIPVLGIIPLDHKILAADRFLYLPTAGFCIAFALCISSFSEEFLWEKNKYHKISGIIVAAAALISCLMVTREQAGRWQTEYSLYSWACLDEKNALGCNQLASLLLANGLSEEAISVCDLAGKAEGSDVRQEPWMVYSIVDSEYIRAKSLIALGQGVRARQALESTMRGMRLCLVGPPAGEIALLYAAMLLRDGQAEQAVSFLNQNRNEIENFEDIFGKYKRLAAEFGRLTDRENRAVSGTVSLKDMDISELGNARRMAESFGDRLAQTRIWLEMLDRPEFPEEEREAGRDSLRRRSICSAIAEDMPEYAYVLKRCSRGLQLRLRIDSLKNSKN